MVICIASCLPFYIISTSLDQSQSGLALFLILLGFASAGGIGYYYRLKTKRRALTKVRELAATRPGFVEFYESWLVEKRNKEYLKTLQVVSFAVAVLGIGIALASDSEDERIRKAVRDELRRRGLD